MLAPILFQKSSEGSAADSTLSKQWHQHITTKAMGRSKPALKFIKHTLKKCTDSGGGHSHGFITICSTPLGQGLPSPATLLFNYLVHSVMPVIDRKLVSVDNDDEHYTKISARQHKNETNNDPSQGLASIPIGSNCSRSMRRWRTMDPWDNYWEGRPQSPQPCI